MAPAAALVFSAAALVLSSSTTSAHLNTDYMSHTPSHEDLPAECAQVIGMLERCHADVAQRGVIKRAFNALGYGGCSGLENKAFACVRHYRGNHVNDDPAAAGSKKPDEHGHFSGDWERSAMGKMHPPPRRSRKDGMTPEVFHTEYLSKGRPVLITDAAEDWPAKSWDYSTFLRAVEDISWAEVQPWNMAMDKEHVNSTHPLTLTNYHSWLPEYPNLYVAWSNSTNAGHPQHTLILQGDL